MSFSPVHHDNEMVTYNKPPRPSTTQPGHQERRNRLVWLLPVLLQVGLELASLAVTDFYGTHSSLLSLLEFDRTVTDVFACMKISDKHGIGRR